LISDEHFQSYLNIPWTWVLGW